MDDEKYVSSILICQNFRTYCKDLIAMIRKSHASPSFAIELEKIKTLKIYFPEFKITHILRIQNQISDFLNMITRSFHKTFYFIGCFILVWLTTPSYT